MPAPAVEAVDTTGAGDVFAGVLAAEWRDGHEDALRRACAAGALSTLVPGAGDCAPYAEAIDDAVSNRKATKASMTTMTDRRTPRPPDGDWLGTPYLHFTREGAFGVCRLDRPEARNAMTPAMYFGIRYAVRHVDADPDLAGLLITGTGDVFAPGGDMGGGDGATTG